MEATKIDPGLAIENAKEGESGEEVEALVASPKLMELWGVTAQAKLPAMKDYVQDILDRGEKFLLFAHHKEVITAFQEFFEEKVRPGGEEVLTL